MQNVIDILTHVHREVVNGLNRIVQSRGEMQRDLMYQEVRRVERLTVEHLAGEEGGFYPRLQPYMPGPVQEALREHQEIRTPMQQAMSAADPAEMQRHLEVLLQAVQHHSAEEENRVFPRVSRLFDAQRLDEMARTFEDAKQRAPGTEAAAPESAEASR